MERPGTPATDDPAVSPVLGVILMVAVTVVLASTAHVFLFSFGQGSMFDHPQAAFEFETESCEKTALSVTHVAGQPIAADQLSLHADGLALSGSWAAPSGYSTSGVGDGTVEVGDAASICVDDLDGVDVSVVWVSDSGDRTVVLAKWSGG